MAKKKATAMWRVVEAIPDVPLALDWVDQKPGFEHIMLTGIDDPELFVQIMDGDKHFSVSILDPHEVLVEEFDEFGN